MTTEQPMICMTMHTKAGMQSHICTVPQRKDSMLLLSILAFEQACKGFWSKGPGGGGGQGLTMLHALKSASCIHQVSGVAVEDMFSSIVLQSTQMHGKDLHGTGALHHGSASSHQSPLHYTTKTKCCTDAWQIRDMTAYLHPSV